MIIAIILHAFRRRAGRTSRSIGVTTRIQLHKLSWRFHLRGALLPPWPNYGTSRVRPKATSPTARK